MNKKDFCMLMLFDFGSFVLLIEHLFGLDLAFGIFSIWTIISMLVHIYILRDYVVTHEFVREDHTR